MNTKTWTAGNATETILSKHTRSMRGTNFQAAAEPATYFYCAHSLLP